MAPNEKTTRKQLIDKALQAAGWSPIVPYRPGDAHDLAAVEEYPTANGPVDYALFESGDGLGGVEAKKLGVGPQNVLQQAQRYSRGFQDGHFNFNGFRLPFVYSTNGEVIYFQDLRRPNSRSRQVAKFHTPAALREMLSHDIGAAEFWLQANPNDNEFLRPYQRDAIASVEAALIAGKRRMLVAMATGTGKTFTAIASIYRLMKSGFARRVLFLVDRRALAAQAVSALLAFEPEPGLKFDKIYEVYSQRFKREDFEEDEKFDPKVLPTEYLTHPQPGSAFVYVCTIQRMRINLFGMPELWGGSDRDDESDANALDIPIHAFDLIIADECHRGYTSSEESKWREVLDHFDGIKVGLTATPAAHTKAYFNDIVFRYEYDRAVREGYLVDYDAVRIKSDITMNGVFLKEGEEVGLKDTETGQLTFDILEDERQFDSSDIEAKITALDRNRRIVKEFAKYARQQEQERGWFPKTLLFAINDLPHVSHADMLVEMLREEFSERGDAFVQKITGSPSVDRPLQRIREFRNRPEPGIVVTVDLLSTGVDIPALENIVFLRPVKSRILFEQMMGRGTRKCDEIYKTHFTVFDCFNGTLLEYFRQASAFTTDAPAKPTRSFAELIAAIDNNQDRDYNVRALSKRLQRIAKNITAEGRQQFAAFIRDADIGRFAALLPGLLEIDFETNMKILRNPDFQRLLVEYPRAKPPFIITTAEDTVTSDYLFRTTDDRELKPEDYLTAFARFVRENPAHVEAIRILLERPSDWRTDALAELRQKLAAQPERFTEENLRRAHQHQLADIISLVKHAAKGEPLLSAEARVDRALSKVRAGKTFTAEQEKWLALIRAHLIQNLCVEKEDFELLTFTQRGATWGKVNKDFGGELENILREINEAMAA